MEVVTGKRGRESEKGRKNVINGAGSGREWEDVE